MPDVQNNNNNKNDDYDNNNSKEFPSHKNCLRPVGCQLETADLNHQLYVNDTQPFLSFEPSSFNTSVTELKSMLSLISALIHP